MPGRLPRQASLSSSGGSPDQRIKLLIEYGSLVEVDKSLAIRLYLRSGREMLRMANMYCDDCHFESAFILYYKFITLFLEKLPEHPDYKSAPQPELSDFKRKVKKVFPIAEQIKLKLKDQYAEEEKIFIKEQQRLEAERAAEEERRRAALEQQEREDEELAKKLQEEEEAEVRSVMDRKYLQLREREEERLREEEERKKNQEFATSQIPPGLNGAQTGDAAAGAATVGGFAGVATASATIPAAFGAEGTHFVSPTDPVVAGSALPPPPSYSQYLNDLAKDRPQVPDRSLKKNLGIQEPSITGQQIPSIDRSKKPSIDHHMSLGQFGGQMDGQLRPVSVPASLMSQFLLAAEVNTRREAETMGILCGKMSQGCFSITTLFIPKQKGGHDSCDMENEEELIFFQDEHNLITLGWIHTHPTQTAFLSSVDLHSHFPWQKMMPEAIAIVCSPKFQKTGIFKLTDHGLDVIGACREKGFHPHNKNPPLFEDCKHVQVCETGSVIVEDRRN